MKDRIPTKLIDRAFELAYFILPDQATALQITIEAFATLDVVAKAQRRRRYYRPSPRRFGRGRRLRLRNRVSLRRHHLLQRLIYRAVEPHERRLEAAGTGLDADDLTVRFVKHLIRITLRRNAFYVAIGLGRLLHRYNTEETMSVYNLVLQDPDRIRDDDYCRSGKRRLLAELRERFGARLQISRGPHGEQRVAYDDKPGPRAALVSACLERFVPWGTPCVIPARLDPLADPLDDLCFDGGDPDAEHPIEVRRIHALLHPQCFSRLTRALKLDPPAERLAVPQFQMTTSDGDGGHGDGGDRLRPPALDAATRREIVVTLAERAKRRRALRPAQLTVTVDGAEVARIDPRTTANARFGVTRDAEILEVWGRDERGQALMAAQMLGDLESRRHPWRATTALEGGQAVSFVLRPVAGGIEVEVSYRETAPLRALPLAVRRLGQGLASTLGPGWRRAAAGLAAAAMVAIALLVLDTDPRAPVAPPIEAPDPSVRTREGATDPIATPLVAVEQVYVDPLGDALFGRRLHPLLATGIARMGRLAAERDQADAVLKAAEPPVSAGRGAPEMTARLTVVLVNRGGTVLWRGSYLGSAEEVADELLRDLGDALEVDRASSSRIH